MEKGEKLRAGKGAKNFSFLEVGEIPQRGGAKKGGCVGAARQKRNFLEVLLLPSPKNGY